jgi:sulfhydrogenase subunit delta
MARPRVAVFKFASCDGCQLTVLDLEDELLTLAEKLDFVHFAEASSRMEPGPYDVVLVEGSITTPHDSERIKEVRRQARFLVTIGACATAGGIQALRNWGDHAEFLRAVYARPDYISSLATSTPIAEHVPVDFELRGCPINKEQLLEVLRALLEGRRPRTPGHSVCLDCKRRGTVCVTVAEGIPCLGPVTQSGCGAICPAFGRGCYGCFGPAEQPNLVSLTGQFRNLGVDDDSIVRSLRTFNAHAPAFRQEGDRLRSDPAAMRPSPSTQP